MFSAIKQQDFSSFLSKFSKSYEKLSMKTNQKYWSIISLL